MIFRNYKILRSGEGHGFTLVETLVAVSILLTVIVGPMTIASKGMQSAFFAGDQTTAVYLAQEAIEHIQQLRDDVALSNFDDYRSDGNDGDGDTADWYDNLDPDCKDADGCDVDFVGGDYEDCSVIANCQILKNPSSGGSRAYGHSSGWTTTPFTRIIKVGTAVGSVGSSIGGVPVTVTVQWSATLFGSTRSVVLQTYVYDHYTRFE